VEILRKVPSLGAEGKEPGAILFLGIRTEKEGGKRRVLPTKEKILRKGGENFQKRFSKLGTFPFKEGPGIWRVLY